MKIEINKESELQTFANQLGMKIEKDGTIRIPEKYGKGYARVFSFGSEIRMLIRNYELFVDFKIKRTNTSSFNERIIIFFHDVFSTKTNTSSGKKLFPSVQVYSGNIDSEVIYKTETQHQSINIGIEIAYLKKLLNADIENSILNLITNSQGSFLFEELISPQIQKVASEVLENEIPLDLQKFYFKVKAEELICLLFLELLKRENVSISKLKTNDVQTIYVIRDKVIFDLSTPPLIADLASQACMSESKLKRLFKQVFGNSLFSYYQSFRIKEAANLLKENKLSVSEVGYKLGFSNLSHFSKVFEEHIGVKPKKYSLMH